MITKLPTLYLPLTPALCVEHAALPQIDGDRKLKPSRVKELQDKLDSGLFHDPEWAVVFFRGQKFRINGKHSATMLAALNGEFPQGMHVTIKQFNADSEIDKATLFDQFDSLVSVRSRGDSMNVHKHLHAILGDVSTTNVLSAVHGIVWYLTATAGARFSDNDKKQLVHQYSEFIAWADKFLGVRRLKRPGVVAAIFATFAVDRTDALAFWMAVRDQSHEDNKHPTRVLGKFLELSIYDPTDRTTKLRWDTRAYFSKSIHGWNAYRGDHGTDLKYHANSPLPKPR